MNDAVSLMIVIAYYKSLIHCCKIIIVILIILNLMLASCKILTFTMKATIFLTHFLQFTLYYINRNKISSQHHPVQYCTFMQVENDYYGLFIENRENGTFQEAPKHFFGYCDLQTLTNWKPCPFTSTEEKCCPPRDRIFQNFCNIHFITTSESHCNCNGSLKSRQLLSIPDFPTCFLGGNCLNSNCSIAARRNTRKVSSMIYNCIQCMTKHPGVREVGPFSLNWSRVKQSDIKPLTVTGHSRTIKPTRILDYKHSRNGHCSLNRKYLRKAPVDMHKEVYVENSPENDFKLELASNMALRRILKVLYQRRHSIKKSKLTRGANDGEEELEDDEESDDDNLDEDIEIEEDEHEDATYPTTELGDKDELLDLNRRILEANNITAEDDEKFFKKLEKNNQTRSSSHLQDPQNLFLLLMCSIHYFYK